MKNKEIEAAIEHLADIKRRTLDKVFIEDASINRRIAYINEIDFIMEALQSAQARNEMAEFAKIDDFEDVPMKTLDNSEQTDNNVAPRKTLNDAQNHNWDKSKFVRIDMETGEKVEPRLEHIEGLEEALKYEKWLHEGEHDNENCPTIYKAAKAYATKMEEK